MLTYFSMSEAEALFACDSTKVRLPISANNFMSLTPAFTIEVIFRFNLREMIFPAAELLAGGILSALYLICQLVCLAN